MPNLGPDYDLAVRLKRVEDQLARMQENPLGQAFSATQSDGSVGWRVFQDPKTGATAMIWYQGTTTARDPNTGQHPILQYVGELYSGGQFEDSGLLWYRPDATGSGVVGNRGVQLFDHKGNQVFATDEYGSSPSGEGLTNPRLHLPLPVATGTAQWPNTTATSWSAIARSIGVMQHSHVYWQGYGYAPAGTNAQVKLVINGTTTGQVWNVTGGSFTTISEEIALPSGFWSQMWAIEIQAQVTSGTGAVYAMADSLFGLGSP